MALTRSTPHSSTPLTVPELATRVAVTLGALAIYRLGAALPLPGFDLERLYGIGGIPGSGRLSVFGLGVMPVITVLLLVEVARLVSERFNDWASAPVNARRINHWVLAGALALAAVQAYGVAVAIEGLPNTVDEPGPLFRLAVVATLAGGTALLAWLATLISRNGVGSGLWILLLAPYLVRLPANVLDCVEFVRRGILSQAGFVSIIAYVVIAVASVAAMGLALARRGIALERTLIWPLYIGAFVANIFWVVPWLLPAGPIRETIRAFLGPGAPLYIAALGAIIIAVSLAQSQRAGLRPAAAASSATPVDSAAAAPVGLTALALAAIATVPDILEVRLGVPVTNWVSGIQIAVAAAIAVALFLDVKSLSSGQS